MNTSSNLTDELSHFHDGGTENATPEVQWVRWVDIAVGSVGLSIGLYSLFVNIIILAVLVRMSRRSVSDTVFCHLAVTDIMASLDAIFAFGILLSNRTFFDFYILDDIICQFTGITWCVVSIATPLLLSIISFGRFVALYLPHKYDKYYSPPLSTTLIISSWIISVIGGTMHVWKLEGMRMNPKWGYCDYRLVDIYSLTEVRYIVVFLYSLPLTVSTLILLVCNLAVALRLIRVQFKKPLDVLVSLFCPGNSLDKDAVVFSNGPSNDPVECSFRSRDGASIEFEMTVTDQTQTKAMVENGKRNRITPLTAGRNQNKTNTKGKSKSRRRKEKQVIVATLLFSLNFGLCYFVMLYYYFSYMINPTYSVFDALSRGDLIKETYILGWFYYATFLSSSINPVIHFSCNSKMRVGAKSLFRCLRNKLARFSGTN
ncbi:uncharacterized protein LOC134816399 [Bolinopsis microptera]|uniref:uncharacterized protein LOC134816399 n=1 Tax=Bolinopsis microptera TaxID=2820187 RepID=UPI003079E824